MMTQAIILTALAVCAIAAGWPLLLDRRLRVAVQATAGSCCLTTGIALFWLVAAGFIQWPGASAELFAYEEEAEAIPTTASTSAEAATATTPAVSEKAIETSPEFTVLIPPGRPIWVEAPSRLSGAEQTVSVSSGPFSRHSDATHALDKELVKATEEYIADYLGDQIAPRFLRYDAKTIKRRFVKPENIYEEMITVSIGHMHQVHARLDFGPQFRSELDRSWDRVRATSRLTQTGLLSGAALLLLGSIFGYFRLDNATRGYYTGRLQFMTAAAILAILGAGVFAARWITWM